MQVARTAGSITTVWGSLLMGSTLRTFSQPAHLVTVMPVVWQVAGVISGWPGVWWLASTGMEAVWVYPHSQRYSIMPSAAQVGAARTVSVKVWPASFPLAVQPGCWHSCQWLVPLYFHSPPKSCFRGSSSRPLIWLWQTVHSVLA